MYPGSLSSHRLVFVYWPHRTTPSPDGLGACWACCLGWLLGASAASIMALRPPAQSVTALGLEAPGAEPGESSGRPLELHPAKPIQTKSSLHLKTMALGG